ncbi:hypothetical protein P4409_25195 [Bacillus thuringiensis]|nr:hypothetical protein [Bacillus thuringiensis]
MRNHYKKLAIIVPLTSLLSLGILAPTISFAAETKTNDVTPQANSIQGYLIKDGVKTPIYQNKNSKPLKLNLDQSGSASPEFPTLPPNPDTGVPLTGTSITESGPIGNTIYFEGNMLPDEYIGDGQKKGVLPNGKIGKHYVQKRSDGQIVVGFYDPDTLELYPAEFSGWSLAEQLQPDISKVFDNTTKIKRETQYELINKTTQDRSATGSITLSSTAGITTTDAFGFALAMGWKVGVEGGLGDVAKISAEFSLNLSASYNHSIAIIKSETLSTTTSVGPVNNSNYAYNKYTIAAYQLKSTYTVIPGAGLQKFIDNHKQYLKGLASNVYKYNDKEVYVGVTPGSHQ